MKEAQTNSKGRKDDFGMDQIKNAEKQAKYREGKNLKAVTILLTEEERELLKAAFDHQRYFEKKGEFNKEALLFGALWKANSGNQDKLKREDFVGECDG